MKFYATCLTVMLAMFFGAITKVAAQTQEPMQSVLQSAEVAQPVLQAPAAPTLVSPQPQSPIELTGPTVVHRPTVLHAATPVAQVCCCDVCGNDGSKRRRRCCPPPVPTDFCLIDPCGCSHEACIEIPACCCGEQPEIQWRNGVLGRQIATLCWACCDFEAKVIVTRKGKVRVRD